MTAQPAAQNIPTIEAPPQQTLLSVAARVLENLAAGVGVAVFSIAVAWAVGAPFEGYQWPAVLGLAWFGALSTVRFSHDEIRMAIIEADRLLLRERVKQLDAEADALDALLHERDRTIAQQAALIMARPNYVAAQEGNADPVMRDARTLIDMVYGQGAKVSQRALNERGWSDDKYARALDILCRAGIAVRKGPKGNVIDWSPYDSPAQASVALGVITLGDVVTPSQSSHSGGGEEG